VSEITQRQLQFNSYSNQAATVSAAVSTTTTVVSAIASSAGLQLLQDTTVKTATTAKLKILFNLI
jgi:hypothetical protein